MTRLLAVAVISASVAVLLRMLRNPSDSGTVPESDPYAEPVPMTWSVPGSHTIQYRYTTGPAGVESSLN